MFPKIVGFPPKSSILIGYSFINHPFWGIPIFGNTHISTMLMFTEDATLDTENTKGCKPGDKILREMKVCNECPFFDPFLDEFGM